MNTKPTIFIILLAALLVASDWAVRRWDRERTPPVIGATPLFTEAEFPVDTVDHITLRRGAEPELTFTRREGQWAQTAPFPFPVDIYSMRQLILSAAQLETVNTLDASDASQMNDLGLNPPRATITYGWPDGEITLALGKRSMAGRAYLQKGDNSTVYVVSQSLHERAIDMDEEEWRSRVLFPGTGAETDRIFRKRGDEQLELVRKQKHWAMTSPVSTRVSPDAIAEFIRTLAKAQSGGFILDQPEDLSLFGLNNPQATLVIDNSISNADSKIQKLLIGQPVGTATQDRYAMIEGVPVVVRLPAATFLALFREPSLLIDHTGSGANPADVKSITIQDQSGGFTLERDLERWIAPDHGKFEPPVPYVQTLLTQLTELRAPRIEIREYPFEQEIAIVTLYGFDQRPLDTIRIARDPNSGEWAFENGDNVLRIFPASLQPRLTTEDYGLPTP